MQYDVITIFPNKVASIVKDSILGKAQDKNLISVNIHDLRKWTTDSRNTVDDRVFGGGPGMLLMIEPIYKAVKDIGVYPKRDPKTKVVLTAAGGNTWNQEKAQKYSQELARVVIICGNYEGVDYRVAEHLVDEQVSIGNYVLTGGELAAGVIIDSTARLLPGVLGNQDSLTEESHTLDGKEYPQYTRPANFTTDEGEIWDVPDILLSGDHGKVAEWRQGQVGEHNNPKG